MKEDFAVSLFVVARTLAFQTVLFVAKNICSLLVKITTFSRLNVTILSARNSKSSVLLSLSPRKLFQLGGTFNMFVTVLLTALV